MIPSDNTPQGLLGRHPLAVAVARNWAGRTGRRYRVHAVHAWAGTAWHICPAGPCTWRQL